MDCSTYDRRISELKIILEVRRVSLENQSSHLRTLLKSPTAPLPTYSSDENEDLDRFFSNFEETLSKFNYPEYDRFLLLKQQVSGRALIFINSLEGDKQSYNHAKELLINALASPEIQTSKIIKMLTEMKLNVKQEPFEYMSRMKFLIE